MARFTSITLYAVPMYYKRLDRIIENIDAKLSQYALITFENNDVNKISWQDMNDYVNSTLTIQYTDLDGSIPNYVKIVGDDRYQDETTYHFLHDINEKFSNNTYAFDAILDVFAVYGKLYLDKLVNQKVKFARKHWDRYIADPNVENGFIINPDNPALINSDFDLGNTVGQTRHIWPLVASDNSPSKNNFPYNLSEVDSSIIGVGKGLIYPDTSESIGNFNHIVNVNIENINNNLPSTYVDRIKKAPSSYYYLYGLVTLFGEPVINNVELTRVNSLLGSIFAVIPISVFDQGLNLTNIISQLQQNKLLTTFWSPYPFLLEGGGLNDQVDILDTSIPENRLYNNDITDFNKRKLLTLDAIKFELNKTNINLYFLKSNRKLQPGSYEDVKAPNCIWDFETTMFWGDKFFNNFFNLKFDSKTSAQTQANIDETMLELGFLNNKIVQMSFVYAVNSSNSILIDIVNWIKNPKLRGTFSLDADGVASIFNISDYTYSKFHDALTQTSTSNVASTYLAQNANQLNTQRSRADLERQQAQYSAKGASISPYSGGILGSIMSAINPISALSAYSSAKSAEMGEYLADNEKEMIQSKIKDSQNTAPSSSIGNGTFTDPFLQDNQFCVPYNVEMKLPNKFLYESIYMFYKKYGYNVASFITLQPNWYKTRETFDYFEIINTVDYVHNRKINISVLEEFDKLLKRGVRIWHKDDFVIDYNLRNLENILI